MKRGSGCAPTNSTVSFTTIFGTDRTSYRSESSGNSVASTTSAVTFSLAIAIWWANLAARGQYGQVGVTNTWMWTGSASAPSSLRVFSDSSMLPRDTSTMSVISVENS
jgi:hypothetical protein